MIGNDVIDLCLAQSESNWKRRGFLAKIYTDREQQFIRSSAQPDIMVWLLWSRKEAVYKIINREQNIRAFNPLKIECLSADLKFSLVSFQKEYFFTKSCIQESKISTLAVQNWVHFRNAFYLEDKNLLSKNKGVPFYKNAPASVSHHGRYLECVYLTKH